ncbi:glycosyltransferase [Pedobacter agri]|uniref:glycosyltransferase n=1 Tax=Pedobacter agri TaxID=454586 RepID=UPI002930EEAE|nr:glycosyltransferase [Pedobacter agri]
MYFWYFVQILIGYNLVLPLLLYLFYLCSSESIVKNNNKAITYDYAIIVTAYKQTELLPAVIDSILKIDYKNYLVYVVADNCDISDLHFEDDRVILLRPDVILANNVKSHFHAIKNFRRNHDILTIIDSDNLVKYDYLTQLNLYFDQGYEAVQGVRKSKELLSTLAALDAARDYYYHFYDGEVLFRIGSSSTLAGSGMAFTASLYKDCLGNTVSEGAGFDKILQAQLVLRHKRIAFAKEAIVYDEKTANSEQLVNQRARWINTWFKYLGYGIKILINGITTFNRNSFIFGFILLRPPLFIFLILSVIFLIINIFIQPILAIFWLIAIGIFILSFYIALIKGQADKKIYQSLKNIPKFIFLQVISLFYARKANKKSIATTHIIK